MRILEGTQRRDISGDEFSALVERFGAADLDVGTGDGRFVLGMAAKHADRLIVGLDPVQEAMRSAANRVTRRRTRLDNVLFVIASVEQMPPEFSGMFQRVFVNLPWGSLMRGLILGDPLILAQLARIGQPAATYTIRLNLRVFSDPVPLDIQDLPEVTVEYVREHLAGPYADAGLIITEVRQLSESDLKDLRTSWTRRLSHQRPPPTIEIIAQRI